MSLLIHPQTEQRLKDFESAPSHAVLLIGPSGSGKLSLAQHLAEAVLGLSTGGFKSYAYGRVIAPEDGKAIGIEAVRDLEHFLSLKVPSKSSQSRAAIIADSHLMTTEAQNALLKILEEPPLGTVLILTASNSQALLPTIRSRVQPIDVLVPAHELLKMYFMTAGFDEASIKKSSTISGGLPGLMDALLNNNEHPLVLATDTARQLLIQAPYERLLRVDELAKERQLVLDTLFILQRMAHISLQSASGASAKRWANILKASYNATVALEQSAQPKLVLTTLMLEL
jgi:hypothetical protein